MLQHHILKITFRQKYQITSFYLAYHLTPRVFTSNMNICFLHIHVKHDDGTKILQYEVYTT